MKFCLGDFFFPQTESLDVISFRAFSDASCVLLTPACLLRIPKKPKRTPGPAQPSPPPGSLSGPARLAFLGSVLGAPLLAPTRHSGSFLLRGPVFCLISTLHPLPVLGTPQISLFVFIYLTSSGTALATSQHCAVSTNINSSSYGDYDQRPRPTVCKPASGFTQMSPQSQGPFFESVGVGSLA